VGLLRRRRVFALRRRGVERLAFGTSEDSSRPRTFWSVMRGNVTFNGQVPARVSCWVTSCESYVTRFVPPAAMSKGQSRFLSLDPLQV